MTRKYSEYAVERVSWFRWWFCGGRKSARIKAHLRAEIEQFNNQMRDEGAA